MQGIVDRKGEQFAYVENGVLFTLEGEPSGRLAGGYVLDLEGKRVWRIIGDAIYHLDTMEPVGFLTAQRAEPDW